MTSQALIKKALKASGLDQKGLAQYLGTSFVSVVRWERGDLDPGKDVTQRLQTLLHEVKSGRNIDLQRPAR
jgi:ribosome-binding protein aMBF1 (putative translation factor)